VNEARVPPHDLAAERAVLGALLIDAEALAEVVAILRPEDFYRSSHQAIFAEVHAAFSEGSEVDVVILRERLDRTGKLEVAGGEDALHDLATAFPTSANAAHYARIVREHATRRAVIRAAVEMTQEAFDGEGKASEILDAAAGRLIAIDRATTPGSGADLAGMLDGFVRNWERGEKQAPGIPTHLHDLNEYIGGFRPGELVIVAGRPSMGKTTLAMNFVEHAALQHQTPVAVFSLEMQKEQIGEGIIASNAGVNPRSLRDGVSPEDWPRLASSASRFLAGARVIIDDSPRVTTVGIRSSLRRIMARTPDLGLVVVDYLQLMDASKKAESRQQEVTEISRSLKAIAREFRVAVIAVCQLSRAVENRTPPRPRMSDLRESGSLEQDADLILLLYREDYYDQDTENKGVAEINVAKHRTGPTGTVRVAFQPHHLRFRDVARNYGFPA